MTGPVEGRINRPKMIKCRMFVTIVSRPARCPSDNGYFLAGVRSQTRASGADLGNVGLNPDVDFFRPASEIFVLMIAAEAPPAAQTAVPAITATVSALAHRSILPMPRFLI